MHVQQNLENYEAFVDLEVKAELDEGASLEDDGDEMGNGRDVVG